ncbi:hypothetical protein N2152v2_004501 [Parachlorella kessleri]
MRITCCCLLLLAVIALGCGVRGELDCEGATVELVVASSEGQQEVYGYPAFFGVPLNNTATFPAPLEEAEPLDACGAVTPPLQPGCILMSIAGNASAKGTPAIAGASFTAEAGLLLRQLAAEGANVTLQAPDMPRVDLPSAAALWLMAVGTLVVGSLWSAAELRKQIERAARARALGQGPGSSGGGPGSDVTVITSRGALLFVVVASAMLLLMFFFVNTTWFVLTMVGLFAVGAWQALFVILDLLLYKHCSKQSWAATTTVSLPWLGTSSVLSLVAQSVAAAVSITWVVCRHSSWAWTLQDVLGIALMLLVLQQLRLPNLKVASILLPMAFLYDVWWVFLQPLVTGGDSVMIVVAQGGGAEQLPMLLEVPHKALGDVQAYSMLGYGDVILPGLLAVFAARFDAVRGLPWRCGYLMPVVAGYGVGLLLTYAALAISIGGSQGQPALLYLVPCTLGCISLLGWWRGQFWELWHCGREGGQQQRPQDADARLEAGLDSERLLPASGSPQSQAVV